MGLKRVNPKWNSWTPTVSGTGWALGNGYNLGSYKQTGKVVSYILTIGFGSTSTFGTGQLSISLPVTANTNVAGHYATGSYYHGATAYLALAEATNTVIGLRTSASPSAIVTNLVPFTWASGDTITICGTYEAS